MLGSEKEGYLETNLKCKSNKDKANVGIMKGGKEETQSVQEIKGGKRRKPYSRYCSSDTLLAKRRYDK